MRKIKTGHKYSKERSIRKNDGSILSLLDFQRYYNWSHYVNQLLTLNIKNHFFISLNYICVVLHVMILLHIYCYFIHFYCTIYHNGSSSKVNLVSVATKSLAYVAKVQCLLLFYFLKQYLNLHIATISKFRKLFQGYYGLFHFLVSL